mgnify:CR=1 FL=1
MAETVYAATREFDGITGEQVVTVDAGTGSVTLEYRHGTGNWIADTTWTVDTATVVNFGARSRVCRFVVSGDATYAI